jgi:transcriptional regulator with GAF, ATPase, and Fis domain
MPAALLASDFFEHEKSAYTGAIAARKGSFDPQQPLGMILCLWLRILS